MPALVSVLLLAASAAYGPELEGFEYAFPVQRFDLESQHQKLHMSYLDVRPGTANGRTSSSFTARTSAPARGKRPSARSPAPGIG